MNSRHRSRIAVKGVSLAAAACLMMLATHAATANARRAARSAIYTASDFERLARRSRPGILG